MNIALIGFGNVGQGFAAILRDRADDLRTRHGFAPRLVAVATRSRGTLVNPDGLNPGALLDAIADGSLDRYPDAPGLERGWSAERIAREGSADVLVEASPSDLETGQPALDLCYAAFAGGKHVVLANKGPVAVDYAGLQQAAESAGKRLYFEATVMAGTPALRLALHDLAGSGIRGARGILNGTTNYILTEMENEQEYAAALAQAQHGSAPDIAGQAIANPSSLILSSAMLLDWLGTRRGERRLNDAAAAIERAVDAVLAVPEKRTRDLGGTAGTMAFAASVAEALATA